MSESVMSIEAVGSGSGWARAVLCLLLLAGCADPAEVGESELTAAAVSSEDSARRAVVDEAEWRLDIEGGEDDNTPVAEVLAAHGFDAPAVDLLVAHGLRGALLETAASLPKLEVWALYEATLARWHEVAMMPPAARLQTVGALARFDPSAAPVVCDPQSAQRAAAAPSSGLDARERRQVAAARGLVAAAVSAHADLSLKEVAGALWPVEAHVLAQASSAALPFANTRCASTSDPALAAARALRMGWQSLTDEGVDDLAWPAVAALLGRALPPAPAPARPALELVDPAGLTCAVLPAGLLCDGVTSGAALRLLLAGQPFAAPLQSGLAPAAALKAARGALPGGLAACASGSPATLLRMDLRAPPLDGTALESVTVEPVVSMGDTTGDAKKPRPPRELRVHGRFKTAGLRPAFFADFSGCELRIELIAQPVAGAPQEFDARIRLSSRLPARTYEALLTDELGRTLAAADAN